MLINGCEVWGFHSGTALERGHLQFCKKMLGVKKNTQNNFVYGEFGRMSSQVHRYCALLVRNIKNRFKEIIRDCL